MTGKPRAKQLGVTDQDYARMLAEQNGVCAICGQPPKSRRLHVDHDHRTGTIRGLLCFRCNRALPNYVTEEWLRYALRYVARAADAELPPVERHRRAILGMKFCHAPVTRGLR